jgi:general secretion pathway protein M
MRLLPEARNSRFLAVALLMIVLAVGYVAGVHWWFVAPQLAIATQMQDLREQQQRFRALANQRAEIERKLVEVRAFEQNNQSFLNDADANSAFSDLTQRLKQAITAHAKDENHCSIISNSNYKGGSEETYERVTIQVRMRCDLEPFAAVVYDLENGNPYLFVDQMMISRQMPGYVAPGAKTPPMQLDIRFNLSGYLRKQAKAAG